MDMIADLGYDPQFGARPLKRVIQKELVNGLSKLVLSGELSDGDLVKVSTDKIGIAFSIEEGVNMEEEE
jgi:ATP-dependent Clp protease ATP-binding subunit ClpB